MWFRLTNMENFHYEKYTILAWVWLILISALTVIKVAPDGLNADILINSVMSLQNLTLYYWGQNRLLNVLPLAATLVKNPSLNLATILILSSISFYGLLYLLSRSATKLLGVINKNEISFKVFLLTSSIFLFVFSSDAISEIAIWHIEYSFPSLLLVFAGLKLLSNQDKKKSWYQLIFPVAALILAIGMNPSTVILAFFGLMAASFYKKSMRDTIMYLLVCLIAFLSWNFLSNKYGGLRYYKFKLEILHTGIQKIAFNLLGTVNLTVFFLLIGLILIGKIFFYDYKNTENLERRVLISYITSSALLFSVGWLLLFGSSRWVEINQFSWRYFIFILFALIFIFELHLANFLSRLPAKKSMVLAAFAFFVTTLFFVISAPKIYFGDYKIFQRVNILTKPGGQLYSGDYWAVWPSVLRDMMNGYEAYGLTYRGEANVKSAREFVLKKINGSGHADVFCLKDTVQNCISQVNAVVGPLHPVSWNYLKDDVHLIKFAE